MLTTGTDEACSGLYYIERTAKPSFADLNAIAFDAL